MDHTQVPPPPPAYLPAPVPAASAYAPARASATHEVGAFPGIPAGVTIASPWLRLGAYLLEGVLSVVTLGIGWLIWAAMIAGNGQTPAKKLLNLRVVKTSTQRPATIGTMFWLRGILAGLIAPWAILLTVGILLFMPFWDKRRQNVWDKVSGTVVVSDPHDAWRLS